MNNTFKIMFTLLLFSKSILVADISIDAQIQEIKQAQPAQRVEMMNALKIRLSNMNSQERMDSISKLRMNTGPHNQMDIRNSQADNMTQMQGMDRGNQKHAGEQYMQDIGHGEDIYSEDGMNNMFIKH